MKLRIQNIQRLFRNFLIEILIHQEDSINENEEDCNQDLPHRFDEINQNLFIPLKKIEEGPKNKEPYITKDTKGFYKCFYQYFINIDEQYKKIFD